MGCFVDDRTAFGINAASVEERSLGRGGIAQDGGTRSRTFHDLLSRCQESQGPTTAQSSMPERDVQDQGEDIPSKRVRAGSLAIVD